MTMRKPGGTFTVFVESIGFSSQADMDDWDKLLKSEKAVEISRKKIYERHNTIFLEFLVRVPWERRNNLTQKIHKFSSLNEQERESFMQIKRKDSAESRKKWLRRNA